MTAILCTTRDGVAYLGADSRMTTGWAYRDDSEKILVAGRWAFAVAGGAGLATWLNYARPAQDQDEPDGAYLYRLGLGLLDSVKAATKPDEATGTVYAIAGGKAWQVCVDPVQVLPVTDCVGGGDSTATVAALYVARDAGMPEPVAIMAAIKAVSRVTVGVGGAIRLVRSRVSSNIVEDV